MSTLRVSDDGTLTYNCQAVHPHASLCEYHNCSTWEDATCPHPLCAVTANGPHVGKDIVVHISHPDVVHVSSHPHYGECIALPPCPGCGSVMAIRVYPEHEQVEPQIIPDASGLGHTLQFHPRANDNLWRVHGETSHQYVPHPTLAHLSIEQIQAHQDALTSVAPDAPVDWMLSKVQINRIHRVELRPHVAHHQRLLEKMREAGKVPPAHSS